MGGVCGVQQQHVQSEHHLRFDFGVQSEDDSLDVGGSGLQFILLQIVQVLCFLNLLILPANLVEKRAASDVGFCLLHGISLSCVDAFGLDC